MDNQRMHIPFVKRIGVKIGSILRPSVSQAATLGIQNSKASKNDDKKSDGPPDLDQVWNDFNQWINQVLGNKKNGGNGDGSGGGGSLSPDAKSAKIGVGVVLLIILSVWGMSGFFTVKEGQTGVVTTFGKYSHQTKAGFNWRWPYPIQGHEVVNYSQVRTVEVGYRSNVNNKQPKEALMLTDDENIIDIQFAVQYKLKNAADWIYNNRDPDAMIRQVAETSIREVVGKSKMDFVLYEGREKVALDVNLLMQQVLDRYSSGAQVANVTMQAVQPPEQVQAAFDDAVKAGQDKERQKNEGQAYANEVIPKAKGEASRLFEEAEAYKSEVVANAEGHVSRFNQILVEYQKAPAVTRDRIYLETMQQIFTSTTKLMMDTKNNNMIYMPLDKLIAPSDGTSHQSDTKIQSGAMVKDALPTVEIRANKDVRARDQRDRALR